MAYVPEIFADHSVEFPNRRKLTAVSGQADTFDVARAEGTVFVEGTKLDAANLNAEFGKIKTETDAINQSLTDKDKYTLLATATTVSTITVSDINAFSRIQIVIGNTDYDNIYAESTISVEMFKNLNSSSLYLRASMNQETSYAQIYYINDTSIRVNSIIGVKARIYGIK